MTSFLSSPQVERWRGEFPQLGLNPGTIYCDGAAGSQLPRGVISRMAAHMERYGATNLGGGYATSEAVTRLVTGLGQEVSGEEDGRLSPQMN